MKGSVPAVIIILCLVLFAGCTTTPQPPIGKDTPAVPAVAGAHYTVGIDADFPPFTMTDGRGNFSGFDIDAARWVAKKEGFTVTFVAVPWDSIVESLDSGSVDIIWSGLTITDEREGKVNFSVPYYAVNQSIAARTGSGATMADLENGRLRIGAQAGSTGADWVKRTLVQTGKIPASDVSVYPDIIDLTRALENREIDVSIIQAPSQKRATEGKNITIIGSIAGGESYAVAVRKTDPALLAAINDGLGQLAGDPYWEELKDKHGLD